MIVQNISSNVFRGILALLAVLVLANTAGALAQEGHPLDGTWSGDRLVNGNKVRVLLIMKLLPDQTIEGMVIENGARIPAQDITLYPDDWSVILTVQGQSRAGEPVRYKLAGKIENLGSMTQRKLVGTWSGDGGEGEFMLSMN